MAEIRIQEKRRPVWPWILLIIILIVAAILLYLYLNRDKNYNNNYEQAPPDTTSYYQGDTTSGMGMTWVDEPGDEVEQFTSFTSTDTASFSREYVVNGLNLLSGAVSNVASRGDSVNTQLKTSTDSLIGYSQALSDTNDRAFSKKVSQTFSSTYEILSAIQKRDYPDLNGQINDLRSAVRAFDPSKTLESQQNTVKNFFRKAGSILSNMKNTAQAI